MTKHAIEPRMLNVEDALYYIGVSSAWFSQKRKELEEKLNFPRRHPITRKYDRHLLDAWIDETGGISAIKSQKELDEEELIARAKRGDY